MILLTKIKQTGNLDFIFLASEDGKTVFCHRKRLERAGCKLAELTAATILQVEAVEAEKGWRVVKVLHVEHTTRSDVPLTVELFSHLIKAGVHPESGDILWRVQNKDEEFVQYLIADKDGFVLRQLGPVNAKTARANLGLPPEIKEPARVRRLKDHQFAA